MLKKLKEVIHPLLFAVLPIIFFYSANIGEVELSAVFVPLIISIATAMLLLLFFLSILHDAHKSAIATSVLLIIIYSFAHILDIIDNFPVVRNFSFYTDGWALLIIIIIGYCFGLRYLIKSKLNFNRINLFLNIVGLLLVGNQILLIGKSDITLKQTKTPNTTLQEQMLSGKNKKPDIYYLILDRYANNSSLIEEYNFDNSAFTDYLEKQGFFVSYKSFANYPKTNLSLASSLNMKHLTYLTEKFGKDNSDSKLAFQLLYNSEVVQLLKQIGYNFIYLGGWWGPTQENKYADYNYNLFAGKSEFQRELLKTTALRPFLISEEELNREAIIYQFQKIQDLAKEDGKPKFIFAHIFMPHYPYLFDRDCNPVRDTKGVNEEKKYLDQLICTNKFVQNTIEQILSNSKEAPVIIIQSDEGPFIYSEMARSGEGVDWNEASDKAKRVHMRILSSFYFPETDYKQTQLYDGISPVNSFRVLFNYYFDTNYDLLPDQSYFIPHLDFPYNYFEITKEVKF